MIGAVEGVDVLAIVGSAALVVLVAFLVLALLHLNRTLTALRLTVEEVRRETMGLVGSVRTTVDQAGAELERVDGLITTAESFSRTVDSASRLAYLTFSNPIIKLMAFSSGAARTARRLKWRTAKDAATTPRVTRPVRRAARAGGPASKPGPSGPPSGF